MFHYYPRTALKNGTFVNIIRFPVDKDDVDYIENPDGAENAHKLFRDVNDVEGKTSFFFCFEKSSKTIFKKNNVSTTYNFFQLRI